MTRNNFLFPRNDSLSHIQELYAAINGPESFAPALQRAEGVWTAEVHCSRGAVLEKAGFAMVEMSGGMVEDVPTDITLLQTIAWPANPSLPGFIIMASASKLEGQNIMIMLYVDLIVQQGALRPEDGSILYDALKHVCQRHGQSLDEYQTLLAGRGMLGACAAECGMLYFFEENDTALLKDIIGEALQAYRNIIARPPVQPQEEDFRTMRENRKKILDWMLSEDYGVKVARQNNIPIELIEAYGFPPFTNK